MRLKLTAPKKSSLRCFFYCLKSHKDSQALFSGKVFHF